MHTIEEERKGTELRYSQTYSRSVSSTRNNNGIRMEGRQPIYLSHDLLGFHIFRAVGSLASTDPCPTSHNCSTGKVEVKILVYCEQRDIYCVHGESP